MDSFLCKLNYYVKDNFGNDKQDSTVILIQDPVNYTEAETSAMKCLDEIKKVKDMSSDLGEAWVYPIKDIKYHTFLPAVNEEMAGEWYLCTCAYKEENSKGILKEKTHKVLCNAPDSSIASDNAIQSVKELVGEKDVTCKTIRKTDISMVFDPGEQ